MKVIVKEVRSQVKISHVWILNFWDRIKKNIFLNQNSNIHFSVLSYKNFLMITFALHANVWYQKGSVSYLLKWKWVSPLLRAEKLDHEFEH
jgi:hypothetical protein